MCLANGYVQPKSFVCVLCSEIQPLETRAAGSAINVSSNMLFTFVIGQSFTTMLCSMRYGVFLFFAGESLSGCPCSHQWHEHPERGALLSISMLVWNDVGFIL